MADPNQIKTSEQQLHEQALSSEQLEIILAPDGELAEAFLTRQLADLEGADEPDQEAIDLARFQLSMVPLDKDDRFTAMHRFISETGKHATFANNGDGTLPAPHYEVNPGYFIIDAANMERWHRLGIDREAFDSSHDFRGAAAYVEQTWAEARRAHAKIEQAQQAFSGTLAHLAEILPGELTAL